jgi:hypothetical protein
MVMAVPKEAELLTKLQLVKCTSEPDQMVAAPEL